MNCPDLNSLIKILYSTIKPKTKFLKLSLLCFFTLFVFEGCEEKLKAKKEAYRKNNYSKKFNDPNPLLNRNLEEEIFKKNSEPDLSTGPIPVQFSSDSCDLKKPLLMLSDKNSTPHAKTELETELESEGFPNADQMIEMNRGSWKDSSFTHSGTILFVCINCFFLLYSTSLGQNETPQWIGFLPPIMNEISVVFLFFLEEIFQTLSYQYF